MCDLRMTDNYFSVKYLSNLLVSYTIPHGHPLFSFCQPYRLLTKGVTQVERSPTYLYRNKQKQEKLFSGATYWDRSLINELLSAQDARR